jgi:hypothetical protein
MHLVKINAQSFSESFGFIVAGPGPGARNVAVIGFRGRNVLGQRVPVDFAGRKEEEAFRNILEGIIQQTAKADNIGIHGLNRVLAVKDGRSDGGGMDDKVKRLLKIEWLGDIPFDEGNLPTGLEIMDPVRQAALKIIQGPKFHGFLKDAFALRAAK